MSKSDLTMEELTKFGIQPEDEGDHPFSPEHKDWNESYFFDWYNAEGSQAGHCRIGWHPNQKRVLLWLYVYNGDEWIMIEECRLPFSEIQTNPLFYSGWGLELSYTPEEPLRSGRFKISGFGRVISGTRLGLVLPVSVDLQITAMGAPHSSGEGKIEGHSAEGFRTNRYEQPIALEGFFSIDQKKYDFKGRGERDHSWGPRAWDMEWLFLVVNGEDFRMQAVQVDIPGLPQIHTGYLHREKSIQINKVEYDLEFDDHSPTNTVNGGYSITAADGTVIKGSIESITGTEIDITHAFNPPKRSIYRRNLIRCTAFDDTVSVLGWYESNRFIK